MQKLKRNKIITMLSYIQTFFVAFFLEVGGGGEREDSIKFVVQLHLAIICWEALFLEGILCLKKSKIQ